jgi:ABC-type transport system involved in multi-copper enzyme maturation permease subunit
VIWLIAKKEFLLNLVNFRFIAGFILCFILSVLSAWILTQDYAERMSEYSDNVQKHKDDLENSKVYSEVKVIVDKRPEPLGLLCEGVEKNLNSTLTVWHGEVPTVSSGEGQGNPLMAGLASLDLSLIVRVIFSLLALLFVYDSISGERERGTLALLMSNPVLRHQVLLGKYLGILLSLFVPILCSMLAGALIIILSSSVNLSLSDGMRLILICLVSLLCVSVFCALGIFVSSRCSRSTTSLMILLFFWVAFVLLIPKASTYIASYAKPVSSLDVVNGRVGALWREFQHEADKFNEKHPANGTSCWDNSGTRVFAAEKRKITAYLERVKFSEPLRIQYADKVNSVWQEYIHELERQSALANNLARISPTANYENLISAMAKTDTQSYWGFINRTRIYRNELISYLQSKKAFTSFMFITRQKEEDMFDGERFYTWMKKYWDEWERGLKAGRKQSEIDPWNSVKPLDLSDMPIFQFKGLNMVDSIRYMVPDLVILIVLNLLFFLFAYISFLRGGVKA